MCLIVGQVSDRQKPTRRQRLLVPNSIPNPAPNSWNNLEIYLELMKVAACELTLF